MEEGKEGWFEKVVERRVLPAPHGGRLLTPHDRAMRVVIGIPMERTIGQLPFFGFAQIFVQGWPLARLEYTRNDIARCKFAEFLLRDDTYTHLLMLDSDHVHPPDIVQRLARWFQAYPDEVQVMGGLNFRRGEPYDPCAFIDPGDGKFRRIAEWGANGGAIEVEALGSGSLMIAREAFETLQERGLVHAHRPFFGYDYSVDGWPGTDMWFSALCREAGITLWCDTTTTSPHVGDRLIDERTYRQWMADSLEQMRAAQEEATP